MIKEIVIDKFKSINHLKIKPKDNFNVIIGENNIGKTTIFEAIHLWKMCYDHNVKKGKKGFYSVARNLIFKSMEFIRVYHDEDIFPMGCSAKDAKCSIVMKIEHEAREFNLGFKINKVSNIDDAYLKIEYIDADEFKLFAQMVEEIQGKNLSTFFVINESKPIPNIMAKEPYMYKAQVLDKIAKGKGHEVLRNKIIRNLSEVESHVNSITEKNYKFVEQDKDTKTYISIKVDGKDIFSYGSGFLQLTEIFSSIEYLNPKIFILLIDEPDSHLHLKLQKRLIEEFRKIENCQMFIITHNERFLEEIEENEILFLSEETKEKGKLQSLPEGAKKIALENLKGCIDQIDKLRYANKIIALEGKTDKEFLDIMRIKYEEITGKTEPNNVYIVINGIDTINSKLIIYSRTLKEIIPNECKWIIIRDTDCVPCNNTERAGNDDRRNMDTEAEVKVLFQKGYGIESTFLSEIEKFVRFLGRYYNLEEDKYSIIKSFIMEMNIEFKQKACDITNVEVHQELEAHFNRQLEKRSGRVYRNLHFADMLSQINENNIQYIMTKKILNLYLAELHEKIVDEFPQVANIDSLNTSNIFTVYYSQIVTEEDIYDCHKEILNEIYL